ncbi:hypothetical protein [Burkholderia sp. Ac-20365]|uniref:hypothetical protein n=1 Tax=Burkholderia sp. Ac-20365 TaxID=2703897 RepID=UPI001F11F675|nr:hypothetical protein [Burkholderia sp. Ac-20365]
MSRPVRARSQKRRASAVSPETENKLARAARSAQRLAQLSDAARDGGTLDLFPDDTARAEQQAMNIDVRQGTLQGFELPNVVLAAVGAPDGVGFAAAAGVDGKAGVRGTRSAAASKEMTVAKDPHHGQMVIDTGAEESRPAVQASLAEASAHAACVDGEADVKPASDGPMQQMSLAAASVVRSVASLRQVPPPTDTGISADKAEAQSASSADSTKPVLATASAQPATPVPSDSLTDCAPASIAQPAQPAAYFPPPPQISRATPELDHARATAFADTVDALYGVISDQRRAADDHTRRMKWMLTIVVCALLMTIAIGIAQTLLLFRLSHQSTAHEQRIEQMMLNQQATLATLLDTDSSTTSLPVGMQTVAAPATPAIAPAVPAAAKPAETHAAHAQHTHKRKSAHTH